ncbi:MAG: TolC family protein [Myxococcota bacterium]
MIAAWILLSSAFALDLKEAREIAVRRSLQVERAEAQAQAAQADHRALLSGNLPSVVGFAYVQTGAGLTPFGFERPVQGLTGFGFDASWRLVSPSGWTATAAARRTAQGQQATAQWAMVLARQAATNAYALALAAKEEADAWDRATADAQAAADAAESLVEAGLRPPADAARARADAEATRATALEARGRAQARCAELQGLLRSEVTGRCDLSPVRWDTPRDNPQEHPALTAAQEAARAQVLQAASTKLGLAPDLLATSRVAEYNAGEGFGLGWQAELRAEMPLTTSGAQLQAIRAAEARAETAAADLETQRLDLSIARVSAEAQYDAARAGVDARIASLDAAQAAYTLIDERYRAGLSGATEWLDARRVRDTAAAALAQSRAQLGVALASVEAARGVF